MSCEYNNIDTGLDKKPVLREAQYLQHTGEKFWEKSYQYDGQNRLVREFTDMTNPEVTDSEITYQRDSEGRLLKKQEGTYIIEYTYTNGLLESETSRYSDSDYLNKKVYFYSGSRLDSIVTFGFYDGQPFTNDQIIRYKYDDNQRLLSIGGEHYAYNPQGRLAWTCWGEGEPGEAKMCDVNEYNEFGQLTKVYLVLQKSDYQNTFLHQEYFYEKGQVVEKHQYSWFYKSNPNGPDIYQTKYEY